MGRFFRPESSSADRFASAADQPTVVERLVWLVLSNERLAAEQRALATRLRHARAYLAAPGCNGRLARANLTHVKVRYSGILALLRANRLEARALLADLDAAACFFRSV